MSLELIARRLIFAVPTILGISLVVFILGTITPGDPALAALGVRGEGGAMVDAASVARVRQELGLDRPAPERFLRWLGGLLTGDLGRSYVKPYRVGDLVMQALPVTLTLMVGTMTLAILIGLPLGIVSAVARGRFADYLARVIAIIGVSAPTFWLALVLILVFAYRLGWFPISGSFEQHGLKAAVLPILAIATQPAALIARLTRASMLEVLSQDYVRTAVAKGLAPHQTLFGHALRNAINPVITVVGFQFGNLIGAAVAVEYIFALPGLGSLLITAIFDNDLLVIQGVVLVISLVFVAANMVVDLLYTVVDPRIRL